MSVCLRYSLGFNVVMTHIDRMVCVLKTLHMYIYDIACYPDIVFLMYAYVCMLMGLICLLHDNKLQNIEESYTTDYWLLRICLPFYQHFKKSHCSIWGLFRCLSVKVITVIHSISVFQYQASRDKITVHGCTNLPFHHNQI